MRAISIAPMALFALLVCAATAHADPASAPVAEIPLPTQPVSPCDRTERTDSKTDALNCQSLDRIQARLAAIAQARLPQGSVIAAGTGMTAPESITTPQLPKSGAWYTSSDQR
ncbi:hypothetical protein OQ496_00360 [Acetobacter suratthaniensis]|uniref:Uncharacterized protein n=1 Tax=Acetobacter suratthaniensis TaxID=1502841 RepID=A0ABS3LIR4_9PROT|nr:hypothetical protein [Acetobacter suratthaniensis]MBO1327485.1 hypothetical protein [Acetobacter suratthaniensis]MCX2564901.1 hypothetical protein [Acetobacter suratthaniensis]